MLAFWSVSVPFIHNKHRFYSTVVFLYQFRYLGSQYTITILAFFVRFCYFYSQKASFLLNFRPSLPVQVSEKPVYWSNASVLVSFGYFYSERVSLYTRLSSFFSRKPVYKTSISFSLRFCYFYSQGPSFLLSCCLSFPFQIGQKPKFSSSVSLYPGPLYIIMHFIA